MWLLRMRCIILGQQWFCCDKCQTLLLSQSIIDILQSRYELVVNPRVKLFDLRDMLPDATKKVENRENIKAPSPPSIHNSKESKMENLNVAFVRNSLAYQIYE